MLRLSIGFYNILVIKKEAKSLKVELHNYHNHKILCNYDNGAVALIDEENLPYVNELIDTGKSEIGEERLKEIGFFEQSEGRKQAYIHVTHHCNMDCVGCYSRVSNRNKENDMPLEKIIKIIDELYDNGFVDLVISGGEPMLRKDLENIVHYAKSKSMNILLITNGSIDIPDSILCDIDILSISLDNIEEEYNYLGRRIDKDMILRQFEKAKANGVLYNGIITISNQNIDKLNEYYQMSIKYEFPITFSLFYSKDENAREYLVTDEKLEELAKSNFEILPGLIEGIDPLDEICCKRDCGAASRSISVDANGNLAPCHFMHDINLGNLGEDSKDAWENLKKFKEDLDNTKSECSNCEHYFLCGRGCLARSHSSGNFGFKDPYCNFYKTYYKLLQRELFE